MIEIVQNIYTERYLAILKRDLWKLRMLKSENLVVLSSFEKKDLYGQVFKPSFNGLPRVSHFKSFYPYCPKKHYHLFKWLDSVPETVETDKLDVNMAFKYGTETHEYIEAFYGGQDLPKFSSENPYVKSTNIFLNLSVKKLVPIHTELRLLNKQYSGQIDMLANLNGALCLIDWKTCGAKLTRSNFSKPANLFQLYLYLRLVIETPDLPRPKFCVLVYFCEDRHLIVRYSAELLLHRQDFKELLDYLLKYSNKPQPLSGLNVLKS